MDKLISFDRKARKEGYKIVAGVDEVGRGCIAGPVVAAACILPYKLGINGIKDSKKLLPKKRKELFEQIVSHPDILFSIGIVPSEIIDKVNIYQATLLAMMEAVSLLPIRPDLLLVDGLELKQEIPCRKIIKGDGLSQSIAAASIIAKVTRDRMMEQFHAEWPMYCFDKNKGYFTAQHREAFFVYGPCPIHRRSFLHPVVD